MQSKSSYSIMTRSKARYGKRITVGEYDALASCASLKEIVTFLCGKPLFAPFFEPISGEAMPSKIKIENALKASFMGQVQSLSASERSSGDYIIKYIDLRREADLILDYVINLSLGTPEKTILKIFPKTSAGTRLDPAKLVRTGNAQELNRYLSKTRYAPLTAVLPKAESESYDITLIEAATDRIRAKMVLDEIKAHFSGETEKALSESILLRVELADIQMIYRAKKYYDLSDDYIRTNLIGCRCLLTAAAQEAMITAPSAEEMIEVLKKSSYASRVNKYGIDNIERFCKRVALENEMKKIFFSSDPVTVLQAYLRFAENETENIVKIVEGISYKKPKDAILSEVIIAEQERE